MTSGYFCLIETKDIISNKDIHEIETTWMNEMHFASRVQGHTIHMDKLFKQGNNFSLSINANSRESADKIFNNLSQGGQVTMPMAKTFWGDYFGMLTDKFDINWMMSFNENPKEK